MDKFEGSSWSADHDFEEDNERTFEDWKASFDALAEAGDWSSLTDDLENGPGTRSLLLARRREVVVEMHQSGLTYQAIADTLGVSSHTVRHDAAFMRQQSVKDAGAEGRSGLPSGVKEADPEAQGMDEDQLAKTRGGNYREIPEEVANPVPEEEPAALLPPWFMRFTRNLAKIIKYLKS